jgi:hypothetical protein
VKTEAEAIRTQRLQVLALLDEMRQAVGEMTGVLAGIKAQ